MIKKLIKLKILKFLLIGGVSTAYVFKKYCDQKNKEKVKKDNKALLLTVLKIKFFNFCSLT